MQISNNLATLVRGNTGNARDQRPAQRSDSHEVARASTPAEETSEPARTRLVETTIHGEVLGREQGLANPNPFAAVTPRTFNQQSQRHAYR